MKALVLTGQNQYQVVSYFLDGIAHDLTILGYDVDFLNVQSESTIKDGLVHILPLNDYDMIFSFNGVGLGEVSENYNTLDYAKEKPLYVFCVDNPIHLMLRFFGQPVKVLCVAQEHEAFLRACGVEAYYFPHAVPSNFSVPSSQPASDTCAIPLLFPVSFIDKQAFRKELAPVWGKLGQVIEASHTVTDFLQLIGVMPSPQGPARTQLNEMILRISATVDKYLRAKQREACLIDCANQNRRLTVIGRDVTRYSEVCDFHQYKDSVSFSELLSLISQSDFVVHQSPGFERGLHERVLYALASGTGVLSYHAQFAESIFANKGVFGFEHTLPKATDSAYLEAVKKGQETVLTQHTWHNRLALLLK